ncbi:hypothetical protein ABL78_1942 [Leptomonas seymouri]|uniref:CHCH domain-containing protein n=1 Tax=Leptomonas seymouri TaxID=5684 RepID=A0A0N0P7N4_LEPSE|nr:hypothetical protein ABL78_1942 [Leptomonas seymouri]|eukprot:KPI88976.1 hypothetical protein ABL78_1942 [Leptomonas seymouri]
MPREASYDDVCDDEANSWRVCLEANLGGKDIRKKCDSFKQTFDTCITKWRQEVGSQVRVKGENEGDPPFQCAAMSCLIGHCLRTHNWDFERCKPHTEFFKHCVKSFYGDDYIS